MNGQTLISTNPYLKDKDLYERLLFINVTSSATIELGRLPSVMVKALKEKQPTFIYSSPAIEKEFSR